MICEAGAQISSVRPLSITLLFDNEKNRTRMSVALVCTVRTSVLLCTQVLNLMKHGRERCSRVAREERERERERERQAGIGGQVSDRCESADHERQLSCRSPPKN